MKNIKTITKALGICVLGFIIWFIYALFFPPVYKGQNLKSVEWLPKEATNITYHFETQFGWTKEYVCSINEADFRNYAQKESWVLEPITNKLIHFKNIFSESIHIKKGLVHIDRKGNGGGLYIHYDLETQKLYHLAAHR